MRYCDLTLAYSATSGGIRTYIDAKRKYLLNHTSHEHVLIIPAERDAKIVEGPDQRATTIRIASPIIPGCAPYRCFWRPDRIVEALERVQPDAIELGSFFVSPASAFQFRQERIAAGHRCIVGGFFHTDLADAYFGSPLREVLHDNLREASQTLAKWGSNLAEMAESGAESFFGSIFQRCDAVFASSDKQVERLRDYGIPDAHLAPLGVDLDLFHPDKRSQDVREQYGVGPEETLILYAGRLDAEKHVDTIVEAFDKADLPGAKLILTGEGPLRERLTERARTHPRFQVAPYVTNREAFSRILASADIYVTAGPHETFGLSVVEAQACGLPVVGVDAGALRERVTPEIGFLGPVDDVPAMARNLEKAASDREAMGQRARQHVIDAGLGWDTTFRELFRVYDDLFAAT